MEDSPSRIAPSPEPASDDSASSFNFASPPDEPVFASPAETAAYRAGIAEGLRRAGAPPPPDPADRLAFQPVPLRYREDGLTAEKQRAYVEALADCGVAREAAARIGLSEQAINRVRRRSDARSFDNACEAAHLFGARRLRSIAFERAIEGTLKGHYYHGELVSQERVYDNRLLIYLLGKTGNLLGPRRGSRDICERWETHMDALEWGVEAPPPPKPARPEFTGHEVREDDDGIWWTSFPPPAGFDGEEEGEFGEESYQRTLSAEERSVVDSWLDEQDAQDRAAETASRDRFFGFAGGDNLSSRQAEPYETSEAFTSDTSTSKPPHPGILEDEPPGDSA